MNIPKIGRTITAAALGAGLLYLLQMFVMATDSAALDNPHIPNNLVNCGDCHTSTGGGKDYVNQGDQTNGVCGQCHNPSLIATHVKVHATPNYTAPDIQCTECHNPHYQRQSRFYKDPSYVATGTITAVTTTTVTLSAALLPPPSESAWTDYFILPNKSYTTFIYKIGAYDGNVTITIDTGKNGLETINTTYIKPGATYAIVYGKLVKEYVRGRTVKFFKPSGTNSFADGDATIDGVCQVCHTQTGSFNNGGTLESGLHPTGQAGKKCTGCHNHNSASGGFAPECNACHGSPPDSNAALITKDKNSVPVTSDSPTIPFDNGGSHTKHIAVNLSCANCHTGGMLGGSSQGDDLINIGFTLNSTNLVANYDGKPGRTVFPYAGWGSTTVTTGNTLQCSNLYCHSTGQSTTNANDPTPTYATPTWGTAASGACGTCHKVTEASGLTSGSHGAHLGATGVNGCGDCHTGAANDASSYASTNHVNKLINVANSYTAGDTPGNGYGTCSAASCHDNGTGTVVATPTWGTSITDCSECHANAPASGSHTVHLSSGANCGNCHDAAVQGTTAPAQHLDTNIDVYDTAAGDLGYPQDKVKGSAYTTCSAASCHDNGTGTLVATPTWGTSVADCSECHANAPATGSHTKHLSGTLYQTAACGDCHDAAVQGTTAPAGHIDGNLDVYDSAAGDLGYPQDEPKGGAPYQSCTTAYCHSPGQNSTGGALGGGDYATVTWGGTAACGTCHKVTEASGLTSGSHGAHLGATGVNGCADCHTGAANDASAYNSTNHVNRSINVAAGLTYNGTPAPGDGYGTCAAASCHDNGTGTVVTTPAWGVASACTECHAAAPATASHAKHLTGLSGGFNRNANCADCHNDAIQGSQEPTGVHLDGNLDVFNSAAGDLGYPNDVPKGGAPYNSCTTASCHSNGLGTYQSATWGNLSTGCNFCHASLPTSGKHGKHVTTAATAYGSTSVQTTSGVYDFGCGNCHPVNITNHMNGTVDITLNSTHGGTLKSLNNVANDTGGYSQTPGSSVACSAAYCHSKGNGTFVASTDWYAAAPTDSCGHCHGNQPDTGSHSAHVVGIHYNNVFSGTTGLVASSGTVGSGAGHGDPNTATTISCNLCHNATVTASYNAKNSACLSCHTDTNTPATGNESAAIAAASTAHLNGSVDVQLASLSGTLRSKAQLRTAPTGVWTRPAGYKSAAGDFDNATMAPADWTLATKTCATACHNSQSITWGETNVTCSNCHKGL